MEFWHRGRQYSGTLPEHLLGLTLPQVIERLGVGYYATVPDFTDCGDTGGNVNRTLGLLRSKCVPFEVILVGVERRISTNGRETVVE